MERDSQMGHQGRRQGSRQAEARGTSMPAWVGPTLWGEIPGRKLRGLASVPSDIAPFPITLLPTRSFPASALTTQLCIPPRERASTSEAAWHSATQSSPAAAGSPPRTDTDTSANTGTRQARSRCCSLRSPAALPPSALPPFPIPGQGGLSTLPSPLSQPTQVGPFQRARSTRHPWSPRRPRAAGWDTGTSGAYGDSPFFQSQGWPHRPPAALPHICTQGSEPATDLCVTSERISMRKVREHDRTKAEM